MNTVPRPEAGAVSRPVRLSVPGPFRFDQEKRGWTARGCENWSRAWAEDGWGARFVRVAEGGEPADVRHGEVVPGAHPNARAVASREGSDARREKLAAWFSWLDADHSPDLEG